MHCRDERRCREDGKKTSECSKNPNNNKGLPESIALQYKPSSSLHPVITRDFQAISTHSRLEQICIESGGGEIEKTTCDRGKPYGRISTSNQSAAHRFRALQLIFSGALTWTCFSTSRPLFGLPKPKAFPRLPASCVLHARWSPPVSSN